MVVAVAAVLVCRFLGEQPRRAPAHPLASLTASSVTSVEFLDADGPQPLGSAQARVVADAIATLRSAPTLSGQSVNWVGARMIRARTQTGVRLSLQAVPAGQAAMIRITADAPPNAAPAVRAEAEAIRSVRKNAYRLNAPEVSALVAPTLDSARR